jgi:glutamate/tyrosine decarboxylase-like PLP-dependent enzyme
MASNWEAGAGAIAAENQALAWLGQLAGYPVGAGGVFVSGGSAANLSALVTARSVFRSRNELGGRRLAFAATTEVHASVRAAAHVMDVSVISVAVDARGAMTGAALERALDATDVVAFAVVATGGTTNAGVIDDLEGVADVCQERGLWMHVDGAYGLAALAAPSVRQRFIGVERSDSFGVDPHKWLFAPYDCAALLYRDPAPAVIAHAQHGDYLDAIDRDEWNPSDYAFHLSRRARGLPLWFSLATYGTRAYTDAIEATIRVAHGIADAIEAMRHVELVAEPELSVVLFRRIGWVQHDYNAWSNERAKNGTALIVPTRWRDEVVLRMCVVNPRTTVQSVVEVLQGLQ